jgi:triosephosphate isomerase
LKGRYQEELVCGIIMQPLIVVNFKTYSTAMGHKAVQLAQAMERASQDHVRMVAVVSAFDLHAVKQAAPSLEVWSQHLDPVGQGSFTGWLQPENAIERGSQGTIINHAEHKVEIEHVQNLMQQLPEGFPICACAADVDEAHRLADLGPTFIAVEPPELIGGDISVTTADPAIVSDTVNAVRNINPDVRVLCGAGVKDGKDVKTAVELGAHGVLLASGVTKASDVDAVLADLVAGLEN